MALATATHASMIVRSHMYDRGIKRARFVVIRDVTIPGVLIEGGFLSNPYDAAMIAQPAYRENLAAAIVEAVTNYRRAVSGSAAPTLTQNPNIEVSDPPAIAMPPTNTTLTAAVKSKSPEPKRGSRSISTDAVVAASAARVPDLTTN
jgi:N-acetylmuramoyl-L-alanine amidase